MKRSGFTLIELLIVISIISLILQMLLPAVQAAREAARNTHCQNNLRQIGVACQAHISLHNHFPTGGWNWRWVGDPDRGFGANQPGGWIYNLLPFLEADDIRQLGRGLTQDEKAWALAEMQAKPVSIFNCPSRRSSAPFANTRQPDPLDNGYWELKNSRHSRFQARSDYAANAGDFFISSELGPSTYDEVDSGRHQWVDMSESTGICFMRSMIRPQHVKDGFSNTYFAGEKYLSPEHYTNGTSDGDDFSMYQGHDFDTLRWTQIDVTVDEYLHIVDGINLPKRDHRDANKRDGVLSFGSPHNTGWNAAFSDGSVRKVNYDLDSELHRAFGNRADSR